MEVAISVCHIMEAFSFYFVLLFFRVHITILMTFFFGWFLTVSCNWLYKLMACCSSAIYYYHCGKSLWLLISVKTIKLSLSQHSDKCLINVSLMTFIHFTLCIFIWLATDPANAAGEFSSSYSPAPAPYAWWKVRERC